MELKVIAAFIVLLTVLHNSYSVPVNVYDSQYESSVCASTCNRNPLLLQYQVGNTYIYSFESTTSLWNNNQIKLTGNVELSALDNSCDYSLQLRDVTIGGVEDYYVLKQQLEQYSLQFGFSDGNVVSVCPSSLDKTWTINVKKAILSAIQMNAKSVSSQTIVTESDINGNCETYYIPRPSSSQTIVFEKRKYLNTCANRQNFMIGWFPRSYGLNEVLNRYNNLPIFNSSYYCTQTVYNDILYKVNCVEEQYLSAQPILISQLSLKYDKQLKGISAQRVTSFVRNKLYMSNMIKDSRQHIQYSVSDITELMRRIGSQFDDNIQEIPQLFTQVVYGLKYLSGADLQRINSNIDSMSSSNKLKDLWYDALALTASEESFNILVHSIQNNQLSEQRVNYIFTLLAFNANPNEQSIRALIPLLEGHQQLQRQVILGISSFVHNYIEQNEGQVSSQIIQRVLQALLNRLEQQNHNELHAVIIIEALSNINAFRYHPQVIQQLLNIALNSQSDWIRVSAINALTQSSNDNVRQQLLQLFQQKRLSNEVRIAAYKSIVMSGPSAQQLSQIQSTINSDSNPNVANYVRSHIHNLIDSSDPYKQHILPPNRPQFQQPIGKHFGISRNYEVSYLHDSANFGVTVETDVVYPQSQPSSVAIPRFVTFNFSIPAFGKELQIIELTIRQNGLDTQFQQLFDHGFDLSRFYYKLLNIITNSNGQANIQFVLRADGKTLFVFDSREFSHQSFDQISNYLRSLLGREVNNAFGTVLLDSNIQLPTTNGYPLHLQLNGSLISALNAKSRINGGALELQLNPQIAIEFYNGLNLHLSHSAQSSAYRFVTRVSSSPKLNLRAEMRGKQIHFKMDTDGNEQNLLNFEVNSFDNKWQQMNSKTRQMNACTKSFDKLLGFAICSDMTLPKQLSNGLPIKMKIDLRKTDSSMKGIEFAMETPSRDNQVLRVSFNTPNSRIDRHIMLELANKDDRNGKKEIRVQLKSPWKRLSASASLQNHKEERSVALDVQSDSNKLVSIDIGYSSQSRGQKREYKPRVRLQFAGQSQPVMLSGSVSVLKGRKNQLQINLESNDKQSNNQKNSYLRGNFIREGDSKKSNDFRLSSDVTLFVPQLIELRVAGIADKSQKQAMTDLNMEYKFGANMNKKESIKLSAKLQNLTQSQLTKVSAFTELQSSQFPNKNFHISYNLLRKPHEHIENEFTVAAGNQQNQQKLHLLQISKMMSSAQNQKSENELTFEFTPMNINYELRANADMQRRTASDGPKYNIEVIGKDRNANRNANNDIRASLKYAHVSRSPLKLQMDATLKVANREMAYHDELKEMSPNEYKGKTSIQWQNDKTAILDYQYKKSANGKHEIETELMTPNAIYPIKHSGMLRMTPNEFEIRSKMNAFGNELYDYNSLYSRVGPSRASLDYKGVQSRFNINPYVNPKIASFEVNGNQYYHKSNVEYSHRPFAVAFKSDTKRDANSILSIDSHVSDSHPSRFILTHPYFDGSVHYDRHLPKFVLKLQNLKPNYLLGGKEWTHTSTLTSNPNVKTFVSNTRVSNNNLLTVDSQYRPSGKSFATVTTPTVMLSVDSHLPVRQQKTVNLVVNSSPLAFEHKSSLQWNKNFAKFASNSVASNQQLAGINYDYDSGAHSLVFASPSVNLNADLNQNNAKFSIDNKKYSHITEVSRDANAINFNSKTQRRSDILANINGALSKQSESRISIATPQITTQFAANPFNARQKSAQFVYTTPTVDHITKVHYQPYESDFNLESATRNGPYNYNMNAIISRQNPSRIGVQIPAFDASLNVNNKPTAVKFEYKGKRPSIGYNHVTEVEVNPAVQDKYVQVSSRTDNQIGGQRLISLDGTYSRMRGVPSQLAFKYGPNFEAKVRVDPYSQFVVDGRNRNYNHNTDVQWNSNAVTVKSLTDNSGNTIAKLDSYIAKPFTGDKSHISFGTPNGMVNAEYYPQKRFKIDLNRISYPQISHKTDLQFNSIDDLSLSSQTSKSGQNIFSLNSALNRNYVRPSHITIQAPLVSGHVLVDPSQRSAKLEVQTARIDHNSNVRTNNGEFVLNSNTNYDKSLLANLNTRLSRYNQNAISLEIPQFAAKSGLDFNERKAHFDFQSKLRNGRHILTAVHINPAESDKKGFSAELSWDKNRNPKQKLEIKMNAMKGDRNRDNMLQISANYPMIGQWELMTTANKNLMSGPHEMTIEFTPNGRPDQKTSLKATHSVNRNSGEFSCKANLEKANKNQLTLKLWGKVARDGTQINAESSSQTQSGYDYHLSLSTRPQSNNGHKSEIKFADNNRNAKYSLSADYSRERNDRVKGNVELEVPQYPQTKVEFDFNPYDNTFTFDAMNALTNEKLLQFFSKLQTNPFVLTANLQSNIQKIPSVNAFSKLVIDERQFISTFDVNSKRILDVNVNLFDRNDDGWTSNVRFDSNVEYLPKLEMTSKTVRNSRQIEYQFEGKYNENQFAVLQLHAEKNNEDNGWNGKAYLSSNGKEFANLKLKHSNVASNAQKYQLNISSQKFESYFTPKVATFSMKNPNKNEYHYNLELCNEGVTSNTDSSCANADLITKLRPNLKWSPQFFEEFNLNARTNGNSFVAEYLFNYDNSYETQYESSLLNVANQKYKTTGEKKTKMLIAVNQKKIGFALESPKRQRNSDDSFDGKLTLFTPQHTLSLTADFDKQQKKNALKLESRVDEEVIFATTVAHVESYNNDEIKSEIVFSAPKLFQRNPKSLAMELKRNKNQMNLKLDFDVSSDSNKAMTISANIDNNYRNNSLQLAINSRDRRINSELKAHIGQNAISAKWDHLNRNGHAIKGNVNAQRSDKQIQLSFNDDHWKLIGETDNDWIESSFWTFYEDSRQVTRLHLQSKQQNNGDHCLELDVNSNKFDSVSRHEVCAQSPSTNYFSFAVNSYKEGQKVTQFATVLDTRSVKSLQMKLKWQPNEISDALEWVTENMFANDYLLNNEFSHELRHKIEQIAHYISDDFVAPIFDVLSQFANDFVQNFPQFKQFLQQLRQFVYKIQENIQNIPDFQEFVNFFESYLRSVYRLFRRQCTRSDTCYEFVTTAERYGYEGVLRLVYQKVYESAKESHRFILTTTGRLFKNINFPSFDEIMEKTRLAKVAKVLYANIVDYIHTIVESNDDLKRLSMQLNQLANEFNREFDAINWEKVQQIFRNLFSVVFSRESWTSSSRVLVWNPKQGEIEFEVRSPLLHNARRLKSVLIPSSSHSSQSGKSITSSMTYSPPSVIRDIKFWFSSKVLNPIKSRLT